MAIFILIVFYLPIVLIPAAFLGWVLWVGQRFAIVKLSAVVPLIILSYFWYIYAGSEIIDPYIRNATIPKIQVVFEDESREPPKILAIIVNHDETQTERPQKIVVDKNGYSQVDFTWPKEFLDSNQFKFPGMAEGYSPQDSSHADPISTYIFRSNQLGFEDPLFTNAVYLTNDPKRLIERKKTGESLDKIVRGLSDFE